MGSILRTGKQKLRMGCGD